MCCTLSSTFRLRLTTNTYSEYRQFNTSTVSFGAISPLFLCAHKNPEGCISAHCHPHKRERTRLDQSIIPAKQDCIVLIFVHSFRCVRRASTSLDVCTQRCSPGMQSGPTSFYSRSDFCPRSLQKGMLDVTSDTSASRSVRLAKALPHVAFVQSMARMRNFLYLEVIQVFGCLSS